MPVVVDANLVVVLATRDPRASMVERHLLAWLTAGVDLHAPALLQYEVANAFARLAVAGQLARSDVAEAWRLATAIPISLHLLSDAERIIATALRLQRQSAYDAAYLVLAQQLGADLWTLDGPLARNAAGLGYPVRLIQ